MPEIWNDPLSNPQGGMFDNMFGNFSDWMNKNPEQFAIIADKIGQGLSKDNPLAGIGTMMGQSSLANKASEQQRNDRNSFMDKIVSSLGGLTPQGMTGVNNVKTTLDKDGTPETSISFNPPAKSGLGSLQPTQQQQIGQLFGLAPF